MSTSIQGSGPLRALYNQLASGEIDRRRFVQGASVLGVSLATTVFLAGTVNVAAQVASPAPDGDVRPSVGTEEQTRGAGGELKIIQWQAPTILSPHVSTGYKDFDAAQLVVEPLIQYADGAVMYPNLITEVPSFENGMLSDDLTSVTFTILPDLLWNDGEPVTAEDIKFTVEWVLDKENASTNRTTYQIIDSVEIIDEMTAKVHFKESNPLWFEPFTSYVSGYALPQTRARRGQGSARCVPAQADRYGSLCGRIIHPERPDRLRHE